MTERGQGRGRKAAELVDGDRVDRGGRVCEVAHAEPMVPPLGDPQVQVWLRIFNEDGSVAGTEMFTCDPDDEIDLVG